MPQVMRATRYRSPGCFCSATARLLAGHATPLGLIHFFERRDTYLLLLGLVDRLRCQLLLPPPLPRIRFTPQRRLICMIIFTFFF